MSFAASGQQFALSAGEQHVTIVEVGGGIRAYWQATAMSCSPTPSSRCATARTARR